jgi:hypothetical protein
MRMKKTPDSLCAVRGDRQVGRQAAFFHSEEAFLSEAGSETSLSRSLYMNDIAQS